MSDEPKEIYVTQPMLPDMDVLQPMLDDIWKRKYVTNFGPYHQKLEQELSELLHAPNISLFSNGTLALLIALRAMDLSGEVIVTPFTFPATVTCLEWCGLTPVFCDIDEETMCLDPQYIEDLITEKTSAILGVHVYGIPCDVHGIQKIADKHNLKVIYDGAHAFMSTIDGKPISDYGDGTMFSLHATKLFNTIEGGIMAFKNPKHKEHADMMQNFGLKDGMPEMTGINAKMNEIQAAVGLANLEVLEKERQNRQRLQDAYNDLLSNIDGIELYAHKTESLQYYPITIDAAVLGIDRDGLFEKMKEQQIMSRRYFVPLCSEYPYMKSREDVKRMDLPVAEKIVGSVLCLPFYGDLIDNGFERLEAFFKSL